MTEEVLTAREAAEALGVDYAQLAAWRSAKKGPEFTKRADGRIFYRRVDLEEWAEAKRIAAEEKARQAEAERERLAWHQAREREMNDGHEFTGWRPAKEPSEEDRAVVAQLIEMYDSFRNGPSLDKAISQLEGELVATCACGWRGYPQAWERPAFRSDRGGEQFISHQHNARLAKLQRQYAASIAAAALRHAAEAWEGDESVAEWLISRAEFIERIGEYDSETWPSTED